jgi:hypothetical protein
MHVSSLVLQGWPADITQATTLFLSVDEAEDHKYHQEKDLEKAKEKLRSRKPPHVLSWR